jgi:hypothetical protein
MQALYEFRVPTRHLKTRRSCIILSLLPYLGVNQRKFYNTTPKCLHHLTEDSAALNQELLSVPQEKVRNRSPAVWRWTPQQRNCWAKRPPHSLGLQSVERRVAIDKYLHHHRQSSTDHLLLPLMALRLGEIWKSVRLYDKSMTTTLCPKTATVRHELPEI